MGGHLGLDHHGMAKAGPSVCRRGHLQRVRLRSRGAPSVAEAERSRPELLVSNAQITVAIGDRDGPGGKGGGRCAHRHGRGEAAAPIGRGGAHDAHRRYRRDTYAPRACGMGLEPGEMDGPVSAHRYPGLESESAGHEPRCRQSRPAVGRTGQPEVSGHVPRSRQVDIGHIKGAIGGKGGVGCEGLAVARR